jgi:hypothetical protein
MAAVRSFPQILNADDQSESSNWHYFYFTSELQATIFLDRIKDWGFLDSELSKAKIKPSDHRYYSKASVNKFSISLTLPQYKLICEFTQQVNPPTLELFASAISDNDESRFKRCSESLALSSMVDFELLKDITFRVMLSNKPNLLRIFLSEKNSLQRRKVVNLMVWEDLSKIVAACSEAHLVIIFEFLSVEECAIIFHNSILNQRILNDLITNDLYEQAIKTLVIDKRVLLDFGICSVQNILWKFCNQTCMVLLNDKSFSGVRFNNASRTLDGANETPLHSAFIYRSPAVALRMIDKYLPENLDYCCLHKINPRNYPPNASLLDCGILYQTAEVIAALFNKINVKSLLYLLQYENHHSLTVVAMYILHEPSFFNDKSLLEKLFNLEDVVIKQKLTALCIKAWREGVELPANLKKYVQINEAEIKEQKKEKPLSTSSPLSFSQLRSLPLVQMAETLGSRGVAAFEDYRQIQQSDLPYEVKHMATQLYQKGSLFCGAPSLYPLYHPGVEAKEVDALYNTLGKARLSLKIIKPENMELFVGQIKAPAQRANLRKEGTFDAGEKFIPIQKSDSNQFSHKFVHLQNKIIPYVCHSPADKKKTHIHTIKQPVTLEDLGLRVMPFLSHRDNAELVGIYAEVKEGAHKEASYGIIKAMLAKDTNTFSREWLGTLKNVEGYATWVIDYNFTTLSAFQKCVENNPYRLNEMLVKLSGGSLRAVVIAKDTPSARDIAKTYKEQLSAIGVQLPIVFRDNLARCFRLYTQSQQLEDELGDEKKEKNPLTDVQREMKKTRITILTAEITKTTPRKDELEGIEAARDFTANAAKARQLELEQCEKEEKRLQVAKDKQFVNAKDAIIASLRLYLKIGGIREEIAQIETMTTHRELSLAWNRFKVNKNELDEQLFIINNIDVFNKRRSALLKNIECDKSFAEIKYLCDRVNALPCRNNKSFSDLDALKRKAIDLCVIVNKFKKITDRIEDFIKTEGKVPAKAMAIKNYITACTVGLPLGQTLQAADAGIEALLLKGRELAFTRAEKTRRFYQSLYRDFYTPHTPIEDIEAKKILEQYMQQIGSHAWSTGFGGELILGKTKNGMEPVSVPKTIRLQYQEIQAVHQGKQSWSEALKNCRAIRFNAIEKPTFWRKSSTTAFYEKNDLTPIARPRVI